MRTCKKYLALASLLAINFALTSCGTEKGKFSSVVGEGDFYCGLDDSNHAKCWRYIVARDRQSNDVIDKEPVILDRLALPQKTAEQKFDRLKMHTGVKKVALQSTYSIHPWVRVCGITADRVSACWDYDARKAAVKPFDLSTVGDFAKASIFDFGTVDFIEAPNNNAKDLQASLFCSVDSADDKKYACHDSLSGKTLTNVVPKKITQLSVGGAVCAGTEGNEIYCSALALDPTGLLLQFTPNLLIPPSKKIGSISIFPVPFMGFLGCNLGIDKEVECFAMGKDPQAKVFPPQLQIFGKPPLSGDLAGRKFGLFINGYALDAAQKLAKMKYDLFADITKDIIPFEIESQHYSGWAAGETSACGLERDSKEVTCFKVDSRTKALTSTALTAP